MSIIVLDLETTGLDTQRAKIIEVAAMDIDNEEESLYFVPHQGLFVPERDGVGLAVSRYFERGVFENMLGVTDTREYYRDLWNMLDGNTVAGSNPRFDTNFLMITFRSLGLDPEPWHHRLLDLSAYAAGVLGFPFDALPGLSTVCEALNVDFADAHSAMGDVKVTRECFRRLRAINDGKIT